MSALGRSDVGYARALWSRLKTQHVWLLPFYVRRADPFTRFRRVCCLVSAIGIHVLWMAMLLLLGHSSLDLNGGMCGGAMGCPKLGVLLVITCAVTTIPITKSICTLYEASVMMTLDAPAPRPPPIRLRQRAQSPPPTDRVWGAHQPGAPTSARLFKKSGATPVADADSSGDSSPEAEPEDDGGESLVPRSPRSVLQLEAELPSPEPAPMSTPRQHMDEAATAAALAALDAVDFGASAPQPEPEPEPQPEPEPEAEPDDGRMILPDGSSAASVLTGLAIATAGALPPLKTAAPPPAEGLEEGWSERRLQGGSAAGLPPTMRQPVPPRGAAVANAPEAGMNCAITVFLALFSGFTGFMLYLYLLKLSDEGLGSFWAACSGGSLALDCVFVQPLKVFLNSRKAIKLARRQARARVATATAGGGSRCCALLQQKHFWLLTCSVPPRDPFTIERRLVTLAFAASSFAAVSAHIRAVFGPVADPSGGSAADPASDGMSPGAVLALTAVRRTRTRHKHTRRALFASL